MLSLYWAIMQRLTVWTRINTRRVYFSFHNGRQNVFHFGFTLTVLHVFAKGLVVRASIGDGSRHFECYPIGYNGAGWSELGRGVFTFDNIFTAFCLGLVAWVFAVGIQALIVLNSIDWSKVF